MEPSAIQFCARKVAALAGDMRKALDVCRSAVEMVEVDVRRKQGIYNNQTKTLNHIIQTIVRYIREKDQLVKCH